MNELMVWSDDDRLRSPDGTYVSPELALVDPELAAWARDQLPNPLEQAALARISSRLEPEGAAAETVLRLPVPLPFPPGRSRRVAGVAAATVVLAVGLLAADVQVEFGKTPASAESTGGSRSPLEPFAPVPSVQLETTPALPATPAPRPRTPRPAKPKPDTRAGQARPQVEPQRFAWAPARGATGYHVELFRGSQVVYAADTAQPAVTIPRSWSFRGRKRTLQSGSYRWYVWPVTEGRRAVRAIVQATVTVPSR